MISIVHLSSNRSWVRTNQNTRITYIKLDLTKRFHVAVRLFSKGSRVTSKCGKNKKVAHKAIAECVTDVFPHFVVLCDLLLNRRTATWNLFVLYYIICKSFILFESWPLPTSANTTKAICLYKMKQSHMLLCVAKSCDWSRKITPPST